MLQTNLKHVMSADEHKKFIVENENVMICCGRMGPMCIPVYEVMEDLEDEYTHIKFADMEFDNPDAYVIRNAPECSTFMGLPFVVYYKNGKIVHATSSIQSMDQVKNVLDTHFHQPAEKEA
jgi:thioredoxin 1